MHYGYLSKNMKMKKSVSVLNAIILILFTITAYSPQFFLLQNNSLANATGKSQQIKNKPENKAVNSYREGELIVGFNKKINSNYIKNLTKKHNNKISDKIAKLNVYLVKVKGDVKKEAKKYLKDKGVKFAEPNYNAKALAIPNDSLFDQQWSLQKILAPPAWDIERGESNPVIIAIADTGVSKNHPDVNDKLVPGYDFINNDSDADDDEGHGTHVAGIATAETNNSEGVAGISWGAKIMPVKVLDSTGGGTYLTVAKGIIYAADNGAKVINLSLGGSGYSQTEKDAVDYAYNKGCTIIAAAGNSNDNTYYYPASLENVISVAATDSQDKRALFSTYNNKVDIAAPGVGILSSTLNGKYESWSGTSMATPHVAGLAALIISKNPDYVPSQVEQVMKNTADDVNSDTYPGYDIYLGEGRINLSKALGGDSDCPPPEPTIPSVVIKNPTNGQLISGIVTVEATVDDTKSGNANIVEAEYKIDNNPPVLMSAKDGAFDSSVEDVIVEIDADGLSNGTHSISVRGKDADGFWSYWASVNVKVQNYNLFAEITYPDPDSSGTAFSGVIEVKGTAKHKDKAKFQKYVLQYQKNHSSDNAAVNNQQWITIVTSDQMVDNGLLGKWNTSILVGMYKLRLTAYDIYGATATDTKYVRIQKQK